jgi:predicted O-methyltransferase YrrM
MDKQNAVLAGIKADSMLYDPVRKDDTQLHFIYDLAQQAPDGAGVEVGAFRGGSMVTWGLARGGRGPILAIDNRKTEGYKNALIDKLAGYGIKADLIETDSWEGAALVSDVAFCFIDANHTYECVVKDIAAWADRIKPGGVVVFHDYGVWKPTVGVKQAVDEWQAETPWTYLGQVGALIAFQRPE